MTGAIVAMGFALLEAELSGTSLRAGNDGRRRQHAGWACILLAVGFGLAATHWIFG